MEYFFNNYYAYTNLVPTDIYPINYGSQQCRPDYSFGPCIRCNYLLHYVYSGSGIFKVDDTEYKLHSGQFFLIKPNQLAYYKADHNSPWMYRWVEFNGSMSENILSIFYRNNNPILNDNDESEAGAALAEMVDSGNIKFEILMQKFWKFIATLTADTQSTYTAQTPDYINASKSYIKNNLHKKVTVNDLAAYTGINRSYLCRLFKEKLNTTPQQYITFIKINAAAQYLKNTDATISEVAQSVGYNDYHVFYKVFKRQFNVSPSDWRYEKTWDKFIL